MHFLPKLDGLIVFSPVLPLSSVHPEPPPLLYISIQLVYQGSSRLHRETSNVCSAPLTAEPPVREQPTVSVATATTALTLTLHRCPVQVCIHKLP